jgi:putative transposase
VSEVRRKRKTTHNIPGHAHCLTFSCHKRLPLLSSDRVKRWLTEALDRARRRHGMSVWAYVIMPEHAHVLVWPRTESYSMGTFLSAAKRPVSWKVKQLLREHAETAWLDRLTVGKGHSAVFRLWQPGGGFDRNICSIRGIEGVVEYLHANPVRRGLVKKATQWHWSSARWWAGDHSGPLNIDPIEMGC